MMNLSFLETINFEINDECNLTNVHKRCPRNADRWKKLGRERPTSDEEFINFVKYCIDAEFGRRISPWYYNEPLSTPGRLTSLMDALPECKFNLWTNGTLLKGNEGILRRMDWIMVTRYKETDIKTLGSLMEDSRYNIVSKRGILDDRINEDIEPHFKDKRTHCPKNTGSDIHIDYYGNLHICCMDWRGEIEIGNIQDDSPETLINKWNELRLGLDYSWNEKTFADIPHVCQLCTAWLPYWHSLR